MDGFFFHVYRSETYREYMCLNNDVKSIYCGQEGVFTLKTNGDDV